MPGGRVFKSPSKRGRRVEGFRMKAVLGFEVQKPPLLKGKRRLFEQIQAKELKLWREKGRVMASTRKPLNVRFVKMKFDFRKMADVKRYLTILAEGAYMPEAAKAEAKQLLKVLPNSNPFMYKTFRVIQVPDRLWMWDTPLGFVLQDIIIVAGSIPKKYLNTILDHEVREATMSFSGYSQKAAHRIAKKREKTEAPQGFYEWLRKKYPEAWETRMFGSGKRAGVSA